MFKTTSKHETDGAVKAYKIEFTKTVVKCLR